ncbi:hypothetical protein A9Q99_09435 [Gammaproteobacteria bacterium 45_16_T64]|nr:hypothetical protein A9Q99_09435 [Gammaproteobacteria bacterium 45_16_T64]
MVSDSTKTDPFTQLDNLIPLVSDLFAAIKQKSDKSRSIMQLILDRVILIANARPDATLAAIHLSHQASPLKQPIYCAALAHMIGKQHEIKQDIQESLLHAILTCNITFYELQVLLNTIEGKLTDDQRTKMQKHALKGAQLVEAAGFMNPVMTKAMRQHHERPDGSGYPNHLKGDDISTPALIIGICETYTARIDNRAYRKSIHPKEALSHLFKEDDPRIKKLMLNFAKAIGVYPPGTWVKLATGETAIVTQVQKTSPVPLVKALFDANDTPYMGAVARDCSAAESKVLGATTPPCRPSVDLPVLFESF